MSDLIKKILRVEKLTKDRHRFRMRLLREIRETGYLSDEQKAKIFYFNPAGGVRFKIINTGPAISQSIRTALRELKSNQQSIENIFPIQSIENQTDLSRLIKSRRKRLTNKQKIILNESQSKRIFGRNITVKGKKIHLLYLDEFKDLVRLEYSPTERKLMKIRVKEEGLPDSLKYIAINKDFTEYVDSQEFINEINGVMLTGAGQSTTEQIIGSVAAGGSATGISTGGAFFAFVNTSNIDLSKFQIYNKAQLQTMIDEKKEIENCIISALEALGCPEERLATLKNSIFSDYIPKRNLSEVAKIVGTIKLTIMEGNSYYKTFKSDIESKYEIVLFKDHYLPKLKINLGNRRPTPIVKILKDLDRKAKFVEDKSIINLFSQAHFIKTKKERENNDKKLFLGNIAQEQRKFRNPFKKKNKVVEEQSEDLPEAVKITKKETVYFADFETFTTTYNAQHKPFFLGIVSHTDDQVKIFRNKNMTEANSNECILKMLFWLKLEAEFKGFHKCIVYFHNLKYDLDFITRFIQVSSICKKDGNIFGATIRLKGLTIELRDSYKMISTPLSAFKNSFDLEFGKIDYIPYEFYNENTVFRESVPYNELYEAILKLNSNPELTTEYLKDYRFEILDDLTLDSQDESIKMVKHLEYMEEYLKYDCLTLKTGFKAFRKNILEITGLDTYDYLTSASLADGYMIKEGCYDRVYELKGNLRTFVMSAVIGGRVCTKNNSKWHIKADNDDIDACSLYPSAMSILHKTIGGLPTGKARLIDFPKEDLGLNVLFGKPKVLNSIPKYLSSLKYYIVSIKITKINKSQQIPFVSYKNTDGSRDYTNEARPTKVLVVDSITLQDYIKFHGIEFIMTGLGVHWKTFNPKISLIITKLYKERKIAKAEKNELKQQNLKLMMNSCYGKTLLKPSRYKYSIISKENWSRYLQKNFNSIQTAIKMRNDKQEAIADKDYSLMVKSYNNPFNHWNRAHCGVAILSISKRIMNEVMDLASSNRINIYYQDTDSMHVEHCKIKKLEKLYFKNYNRILIGKDMGQFHNDLSLNGAEAVSKELIILGKKSYFDLLENQNGDVGSHIRMKGVGQLTVEAHTEYGTPIEQYLKMFRGETLEYDLTRATIKFKHENGYVHTVEKFIRRQCYKYPVGDFN